MRRFILGACDLLDPIFYKIRRLILIKVEGQSPVFRVRLMRYRGNTVELTDGNLIKKGDTLLKIHLHNIKILQSLHGIKSPVRKTYKMYQMVEQALPALAEYIQQHKLSHEIKGICGITMLNQLVERLGFEIKPIKSRTYRFLKYTTQTPIHYLGTGSISGLYGKREIFYLMMSKEELVKNYLNSDLKVKKNLSILEKNEQTANLN